MRHVFACSLVILVVAVSVPAAGAGNDEVTPKAAETIRQEIEALEAKLARLHDQEETAEKREDMARELAEIQEEARRRMKEYDEYLKDLNEGEGPLQPARQALVEAAGKQIAACMVIDRKILALKGMAALTHARELAAQYEVMEAGWHILLEPKYERAAEFEQMELEAREIGARKSLAILRRLKQLHLEDLADAEKEFALRTARIEAARKIDALAQEFWKTLEAEQPRD